MADAGRPAGPPMAAFVAALQSDDQRLWVIADQMLELDLEATYLAADMARRVLGQVLSARHQRWKAEREEPQDGPHPHDGGTGPEGVWVGHYSDGSAVVPFATEVECLRWAVENCASVAFVPYGVSVREAATAKSTTPEAQS